MAGKSDIDRVAVIPRVDLAIVAVRAERIAEIVSACARSRCRAAIVLNGPEGDLEAAASPWDQLARLAGLRRSMLILGPNSQGVLSLPNRLFAGTGSLFRHHQLRRGGVAVVTQSGFGHALVTLGDAAGFGFNHIVATGNEAGLDIVDAARWLISRDEVQLVWLILESARRGRALAEIGRQARDMGKPMLVWKTGHSAAARVAAASHTGAIASDARIFRAALHAGRFVSVHGEDELIDATRALISSERPSGSGVGIVTVSGGAGVALVDCCTDAALAIPSLTGSTVQEIRPYLPPTRPVENPLDVTRAIVRDPGSYAAVVRAVAGDPGVGQVILCHGGIEGASAEVLAQAVAEVVPSIGKPVLVVWPARAGRADPALAVLEQIGIPCFSSVHRAASAAAALWAATAPVGRAVGRERIAARVRLQPPDGGRLVGEREAKAYLARYGIPVASEVYLAFRDGELVSPAGWPLAFPAVLKVDTTDVRRRREAGLIRFGLPSESEALSVGRDLIRSAQRRGIGTEGVLVQEMVEGLEVFLGGLVDPSFGPVVTVGLGGPFVEALGRPTFRLAPLSLRGARQAVRLSEIGDALSAKQTAAVADALARLSWLLVDQAGWIEQIDVNPLFVTKSGVLAADALVVPARGASSTVRRSRWSSLEPLD